MLDLATVCDAATSLMKVGFRRTELHNESLYLKKFLGLSFSTTLLAVEVQFQDRAHQRSPDSGILLDFLFRDSSEKAVGETGLDSGICSILYFSM